MSTARAPDGALVWINTLTVIILAARPRRTEASGEKAAQVGARSCTVTQYDALRVLPVQHYLYGLVVGFQCFMGLRVVGVWGFRPLLA